MKSIIYSAGYEVYGVRFGIISNKKSILSQLLQKLPDVLPVKIIAIDLCDIEVSFSLIQVDNHQFRIEVMNEDVIEIESSEKISIEIFLSRFRVKIAEHADSFVFLHSGAVAFDGNGIIFPANSFDGKSRLSAEFVKQGFLYYSDEYAVIDHEAKLHPFPKMISLRSKENPFMQTDFAVNEFGETGCEAVPIKFVLLTEFKENANWNPVHLGKADSMIELIPHILPLRYRPDFALSTLKKVLDRATILKSSRGEAAEVVKSIRKFFLSL